MNKTVSESREFAAALLPTLRTATGVEIVLCPPFTALFPVAAVLQGSGIGIGAQNLHWESKGAFTGEISAPMIAEFCQYVIIGHSERRSHFQETDEQVNRKIMAAGNGGLIPIVCIGETLSEYESNQTEDVITRQIQVGMKGLDEAIASKLIIAYEPVWAIGTGRASTGENANQVIGKIIRRQFASYYGEDLSQAMRVLYGGSVTATNAPEFFSQPEIDGALVGGASLKQDDFSAIVKAAMK
jgi:triosephosphate isomerase